MIILQYRLRPHFVYLLVIINYSLSNTGVFILIAVCGYKLLLIVPLSLFFSSETWLSPTLSCLTYQSVPAAPPHYRLSSLSSF